jgi:hypothetical protein
VIAATAYVHVDGLSAVDDDRAQPPIILFEVERQVSLERERLVHEHVVVGGPCPPTVKVIVGHHLPLVAVERPGQFAALEEIPDDVEAAPIGKPEDAFDLTGLQVRKRVAEDGFGIRRRISAVAPPISAGPTTTK